MRVRVEPIGGLWEEAAAILEAGFARWDIDPETPLDVDREAYERAEALGMLRVYVARSGDGGMLGYLVMMISPSLRRRRILQASQDVLHVDEDAPAWTAAALVRASDRDLRALGVRYVYHTSPKSGRLQELLSAAGYTPIACQSVKLFKE